MYLAVFCNYLTLRIEDKAGIVNFGFAIVILHNLWDASANYPEVVFFGSIKQELGGGRLGLIISNLRQCFGIFWECRRGIGRIPNLERR